MDSTDRDADIRAAELAEQRTYREYLYAFTNADRERARRAWNAAVNALRLARRDG